MRPSKWIQRGKAFVADERLGNLILTEQRQSVESAISEIEEAGKGTQDQWATIRYGVGYYERLLAKPDTTMVPHMGIFRDLVSSMIKCGELFYVCQQNRRAPTVVYEDPELIQILDDARTIKAHLDEGGYHIPAFDRVATALYSRLERITEVWHQQNRDIIDHWMSHYTPLSQMVQGYRALI